MKKGISLIVLVITIIVMIIIAGAIILSLNSSNVTGRGNLSTLANDRSAYMAEYSVVYSNAMAALDKAGEPVAQEAAFKLAITGTVDSTRTDGTAVTLTDKMSSSWIYAAGSDGAASTATMTDAKGVVWTITSTGKVTAQVSDLNAYSLVDADIATGKTYNWVSVKPAA